MVSFFRFSKLLMEKPQFLAPEVLDIKVLAGCVDNF
jgi:hypothetical protein